MEDGKSTVVLSEEQELTTKRAAELLGMAHHYMIRELDDGIIPSLLVGKDRRVALQDVLAYAKRQAEVRAALAGMTRDAVEAGLYDNHIGLLEGQSDE
jgi:excisionase family DNA binding protein